MNLLEEKLGSVFWTADGTLRIRVEHRRGTAEIFECTMFGIDGEPKGTRSYHANGVPVHGNVYDHKLVKTLHTPNFKSVRPEQEEFTELGPDEYAAKHGIAATVGHLASNGGLRGHSVGDVFPWIPFFKGPFYNQWVRSPDGLEHGPFDTVEEMKAFITVYTYKPVFPEYSSLYVYDYENYDDAYEAKDCGALYETPSTVDAVQLDHRNGIYDLQEVVQVMEQCLGRKVEAGILDNNGVFFSLSELIDISIAQEK